jgi:glycosyltransferase involved in cell wall biosynthesis
MRFLMLNWRDPRNPRSGGAERVTEGYLTALAGRGHEVVWFANRFAGASAEEFLNGVRLVRAGVLGSSVLEARRWVRQQPCFDLVIDQHHGIPWYAPWWCGTRCVAYVHEVLGPIWRTFYRRPWSDIGRIQERWTHWLYREVPFWTACESTRDGLRRHGVRRISILRYGVHTQALGVLNPKPLAQPLRLAVVTRLAPNKRVDHALSALRILHRRGFGASMVVVGTGDGDAFLRQKAVDLGLRESVKFTGLLPEPEKDVILREAHLLLHTSVREGWGLNVIEANALGTPAVVYPVPGLIESTLHDRTGLVAERETAEALADRVVELLADDARYQRLRHQAWDRAKTMHWSQVLPPACDWLEARARGEPLPADDLVAAEAGGDSRDFGCVKPGDRGRTHLL